MHLLIYSEWNGSASAVWMPISSAGKLKLVTWLFINTQVSFLPLYKRNLPHIYYGTTRVVLLQPILVYSLVVQRLRLLQRWKYKSFSLVNLTLWVISVPIAYRLPIEAVRVWCCYVSTNFRRMARSLRSQVSTYLLYYNLYTPKKYIKNP